VFTIHRNAHFRFIVSPEDATELGRIGLHPSGLLASAAQPSEYLRPPEGAGESSQRLSFCEYADTKPRKTPIWFALSEDRRPVRSWYRFTPSPCRFILTTASAVDQWLEAETAEALALQRPLRDDALRIVAKGEKEDGVGVEPVLPLR